MKQNPDIRLTAQPAPSPPKDCNKRPAHLRNGPASENDDSPAADERHTIWGILGQAELVPERCDLWPRLAKRLADQNPGRKPARRRRAPLALPLAKAATVLAALSVGHLAGRGYLAVNRVESLVKQTESAATQEQMRTKVVGALHLETLQPTSILALLTNSWQDEGEPRKENQHEVDAS